MSKNKKTEYKGCVFFESNTTTDSHKIAFGRQVPCLKYLYGVSGRLRKSAGSRPFLTSLKECREYVNQCDDDALYRAALQAANDHLFAIEWTPGDGLTDKALGLGEEAWGGGCPDGVSARFWTHLCDSIVREEAKRRTEEQ